LNCLQDLRRQPRGSAPDSIIIGIALRRCLDKFFIDPITRQIPSSFHVAIFPSDRPAFLDRVDTFSMLIIAWSESATCQLLAKPRGRWLRAPVVIQLRIFQTVFDHIVINQHPQTASQTAYTATTSPNRQRPSSTRCSNRHVT